MNFSKKRHTLSVIFGLILTFSACGQMKLIEMADQESLSSILALAPKTCALPAEISNVWVSEVTRTTARIHWTSTLTGKQSVKYGETTSYGKKTDTFILKYKDTYTTFIGGLKPGSAHFFCPQIEGSTPTQSKQFAFQTLPGEEVLNPIPPLSFAVENPTRNGLSLKVAADCSNLQALIDQAAAADTNLNHEIRLPLGTVCNGRFNLTSRKDGSGWITLRPDISDDEMPLSTSQAHPSFAAKMPIIRTNFISAWYYNTQPTDCAKGDFWWDADSTDWGLYQCTNATGPVYTPIPVSAQGTQVPATCQEGNWFFKTDEASRHEPAWWCLGGKYQKVHFDNGGFFSDFAALAANENSHHYRILGLQISHYPIPMSYAESFNGFNARKKGNTTGCLAYTKPSTHHITFDRVWFRGQGYPASVWYALCQWDGSYQAIVNSYFSEINRWVHPTSYEDDSRAINIDSGPGPGLVQNNTFENAVGITFFVNDDVPNLKKIPSDYVIKQNRFLQSDAYNALHPSSNGRYYYRRHHFEIKRGIRWLIEGNLFDGGWAAKNQGAAVAFSPRVGGIDSAESPSGIKDIDFKNNKITNVSQGFILVGHTDLGETQTFTTQRVSIDNNLFDRIGGPLRNGWGGEQKATGQIINLGLGLEDFQMTHNTVFRSIASDCCMPNFIGTAWWELNSGLRVLHNIYTYDSNFANGGIWLGGSFEGTEALDTVWKSGDKPSHLVTSNVFLRTTGDPKKYPNGNFWVTSSDQVGFNSDKGLTAQSEFRSGGPKGASDGKDMGANISELQKAMVTLTNVQLSYAGTGSVSVAFNVKAKNTGLSCSVDYSTAADFANFNRSVSSQASENRTVQISSLNPGTLYYFRVQCGPETNIQSFRP